MSFKDIEKVAKDKRTKQTNCKYCGHTMSFYAFEPEKKVCSWCGRLNYVSDAAEFKDKLIRETKKVK